MFFGVAIGAACWWCKRLEREDPELPEDRHT
jgi:hypothetical protein